MNQWAADFLPNAEGYPRRLPPVAKRGPWFARLAQAVLRTPLGGMEPAAWARLGRKLPDRTLDASEVGCSADCCKDHVDARGRRMLAAYARICAHGAEP